MRRGRHTMGMAMQSGRLAMLQRRELSKASNRDKVPLVPSKPPRNDPAPPTPGPSAATPRSDVTGGNVGNPSKGHIIGSLPNPPAGSGGIVAGHSATQPHRTRRPSGAAIPIARTERVRATDPATPVVASGSVSNTAPKLPPGAAGGVPGGGGGSSRGLGASSGGTGSTPRPTGGNHWRLHPALPLDVRLLGTGLVAAVAAYLYSSGTLGDPFGQGGNSADSAAGSGGSGSDGGRDGRSSSYINGTAENVSEEPSAAIIREEYDNASGFHGEKSHAGEDGGSNGPPDQEIASADSNEARLWASKEAALRPPNDTASLDRTRQGGSQGPEDLSDARSGHSSGSSGSRGSKDSGSEEKHSRGMECSSEDVRSGTAHSGIRKGTSYDSSDDGNSGGSGWPAIDEGGGRRLVDKVHRMSSSIYETVADETTLEQPVTSSPTSTAQTQHQDSDNNNGSAAGDGPPLDVTPLTELFNSALSPAAVDAFDRPSQATASKGEGGITDDADSAVRQAVDAAEVAVASARQAAEEALGMDGSRSGHSTGADKDCYSAQDGTAGSHREAEAAGREASQGAEELHDRSLGFAGLEMPFMGDSEPSPPSSSPEATRPSGDRSLLGGSGDSAQRRSHGVNGGDDKDVNEPGRTRGVLGLENDLTSRNLVATAMERDEGEDTLEWVHYQARRRQALSDARTFDDALRSAHDFHQRELRLRDEATHRANNAVQQLQELLQQQADDRVRGEHLLSHQAKQKLEQELRRQGSQMQLAAEETANQERLARHRELDSLRIRLGALGRAFSTRSNEARISHQAHKVALSVLALQDALQKGAAFQAQLESLAIGGQEDPLVRAALSALPQQLADSGLPTVDQLSSRFSDVSRSVAQLSYLPPNSVGLLSLAACKVAASLKVGETDTHERRAAADEGASPRDRPRGTSSALAAAGVALSRGDLLVAATLLEQSASGSAAEAVAAEWVAAARARASADQTLCLLQAHAMAMTSSLS